MKMDITQCCVFSSSVFVSIQSSLTLTCTAWYLSMLISVGFLVEQDATDGLQR